MYSELNVGELTSPADGCFFTYLNPAMAAIVPAMSAAVKEVLIGCSKANRRKFIAECTIFDILCFVVLY